MDVQQLLTLLSESAGHTRSQYHLTLGGLIKALKATAPDVPVIFDTGNGVGHEMSYRGYYSDMALDDGEVGSAGDLLARLEKALDTDYEGYKGGSFTMTADTPLWNASYGEHNSRAVVSVGLLDKTLVLRTTTVEG